MSARYFTYLYIHELYTHLWKHNIFSFRVNLQSSGPPEPLMWAGNLRQGPPSYPKAQRWLRLRQPAWGNQLNWVSVIIFQSVHLVFIVHRDQHSFTLFSQHALWPYHEAFSSHTCVCACVHRVRSSLSQCSPGPKLADVCWMVERSMMGGSLS